MNDDYRHLAIAILAQAYRDSSKVVKIDSHRSKDGLYRDICNVEMALDALDWILTEECEVICDGTGYCYELIQKYAEKEQTRWTSVLANLLTLLGNRGLKRGRASTLRSTISL